MLHLQKQLRMEVDDTFSWNIIIKKILIITFTFDITTIVMKTSLNEMFLMRWCSFQILIFDIEMYMEDKTKT